MMKAGRFLVFAPDLAHGLQPRLSFCGQAERLTAAVAFIWRAFNQTFRFYFIQQTHQAAGLRSDCTRQRLLSSGQCGRNNL
jgi:hypothetical protein